MSEMRLPIGAPEEEATPSTSKPVGFVQRELERVAAELARPQEPEIYAQLYVAQQALAWTLEPGAFSSPADVIDRDLVQPVTDTQEDSAGCWAAPRRSQF